MPAFLVLIALVAQTDATATVESAGDPPKPPPFKLPNAKVTQEKDSAEKPPLLQRPIIATRQLVDVALGPVKEAKELLPPALVPGSEPPAPMPPPTFKPSEQAKL